MITLIVTLFRVIKEIFKILYRIVLFTLVVGTLTAGIDYARITTSKTPLFNIKFYKVATKKQTFQGLFYKATRKVRTSPSEPLSESSKITFKILNKYPVKIENIGLSNKIDYLIETKEIENCTETSKLYYADENVKVYTYCLEEFNIEKNKKNEPLLSFIKEDPSFIDDVDSKLAFIGLYYDGTTERYVTRDNDNIANNGLAMFKCNSNGITDIYFGPRTMQMQNDFCTYKDDDFKFIYKIEELEHQKVEQVETFWEDSENYYQFPEVKSDYVVLKAPAIRGKQEQTVQLKVALAYNIVTIEELKEKGLEFNVVSKTATTPEESNS